MFNVSKQIRLSLILKDLYPDTKGCLLFHEFAVAGALGLVETEALGFIGLILRVVALEIEHAAFAFESEDVGTDTVEEPTVVADDDGTAGKGLQTFLERTKRVHVDIVGGLVE